MSDLDWVRQKDDERRRREDADLRAAREQAEREGKAPFDFARLCEICAASSELSSDSTPSPETARSPEVKGQLDFPRVRTLEEFTAELEKLRPWR